MDVATGLISTVVGIGIAGFSGDGGQATVARIGSINVLSVDPAGNLFTSDVLNSTNHCLRWVPMPAGVITKLAGSGTPRGSKRVGAAIAATINTPDGVYADCGGKVFLCDRSNHRIRAVK